MMDFQEVSWDEWIGEVKEYLEEHFKEVGAFNENLLLDPTYDLYEEGAKGGNYILYTIRVEDKTVGYATWWIGPHSYHSGHDIAVSDLIYLAPEYRGKCMIDGEESLVIASFIQWCEEELYANHGVDMICINVHLERDFSGILEQSGYKKTTIVCSKYLGN